MDHFINIQGCQLIDSLLLSGNRIHFLLGLYQSRKLLEKRFTVQICLPDECITNWLRCLLKQWRGGALVSEAALSGEWRFLGFCAKLIKIRLRNLTWIQGPRCRPSYRCLRVNFVLRWRSLKVLGMRSSGSAALRGFISYLPKVSWLLRYGPAAQSARSGWRFLDLPLHEATQSAILIFLISGGLSLNR